MPITNYFSINGELIGEKVGTNARTDYLTDALGYVTATLNTSGAIVNTYRYKPDGAQLAKTGAGADPTFRWVGNQGYRQTGKKYSDVYVRARHYDERGGRWTANDPLDLADGINVYAYARCTPTTFDDPSGTQSQKCLGERGPSPYCEQCLVDKPGHRTRVPPADWHRDFDDPILKAIRKYCGVTCPHLQLHDFLCQIWAESDGDARMKNGPNSGLFQISKDIWDKYSCRTLFGPYVDNVFDPAKNVECAIKAICKVFPGKPKDGFHCHQTYPPSDGWGTNPTPDKRFDCCENCAWRRYSDPPNPRRMSPRPPYPDGG
jgi:RHS repeat-associated protein